jgi:hypothetical protein
VPLDVVINIDIEFLRRNHITGTPRTIVISNEGRVLRDWIGVFVGDTQRDVEQFFGVRLPGLSSLVQTF